MIIVMAIAGGFIAGGAWAQADYPNRPIRVIVPYAQGGTDQQVRTLAPSLVKLLGQQLVIENREGGGATVGTAAVKAAAADGYTLLYTGTGAMTVAVHMRQGVPYTIDDFVPIGNVVGTPFVVAARPDAPFKTLPELLDFARSHPGKINFGSAGIGTTTHMTGEALQAATRIAMTHVPYQGIGPAVRSILGGNVDIVIGLPGPIVPQVRGGKLTALATTGSARLEFLPEHRTLREHGVDVVEITKFGFFAPKGTPEPVVAKLVTAVAQAVRAPDFVEATKNTFNTILYVPPAEYRRMLDEESRLFAKMIVELKLTQ